MRARIGFYTNYFLVKSCLVLAEKHRSDPILNFILYFLMIRAVMIPRIIPVTVQIIMNTKESVLSGKNLGNIFTQYAVIAAEYTPIIFQHEQKISVFFRILYNQKKNYKSTLALNKLTVLAIFSPKGQGFCKIFSKIYTIVRLKK